jgi:hypothetical protein
MDKINENMINTCKEFSSFFEKYLNESINKICLDCNFYHKIKFYIKKHYPKRFVLSEEWYGFCIPEYTAAQLFTDSGRLKDYYISDDDTMILPFEFEEKLKHFSENPWFYSVFEVRQKLENDFYIIYDFFKDEEFLLYSKSLNIFYGEECNLFMFLLYYNGKCYQSYGYPHYYKGFMFTDIKYFVETYYDFVNFDNGDLSFLIERNPIPFYFLDIMSEIKMTKRDDNIIGMFGIIFKDIDCKLTKFVPEKYGDEFIVSKKGDMIQYEIKEWNEYPHFSRIIYRKSDETICISSRTKNGFEYAINLFKRHQEMVYDIDTLITANMYFISKLIFKNEFPSLEYEKCFDDVEKSNQDDEVYINNFSMFVSELTKLHNKESKFSLENLSLKYHIPLEEAENILRNQFKGNLISQTMKVLEKPVDKNQIFYDKFYNNKIFDFHICDEAILEMKLTIFIFQKLDPEEAEGLNEHTFLENFIEFYEDLFESKDHAILNYFFYLLYKNGEKYKNVSYYIDEILKTVCYRYVDTLDYYCEDESDDNMIGYKAFDEDYVEEDLSETVSWFILMAGIKYGLVDSYSKEYASEYDKREDYDSNCIRASDLFYYLISINDEYIKSKLKKTN